MIDPGEIEAVRDGARRLVRELGFMRPTLAGTALHASAVHALIEIGRRPGITAGELVAILVLDKSSVSRMVRKLVRAGMLAEAGAAEDGRLRRLSLTVAGRETLRAIDGFATRQVAGALDGLAPDSRRIVAAGLECYAGALERRRSGGPVATPAVEIRRGYRTGLIGEGTSLHAGYYARTAGFGAAFEAQVAAGMAEFAGRLDHPMNAIWTAAAAGELLGMVAIDGQDLGRDRAHLRWFIVADAARGQGIGRRLLAAALAFVDEARFASTELWTFAGLDAARHLYEAQGFRLVEETTGRRWGGEVLEQRFSRLSPGGRSCPG